MADKFLNNGGGQNANVSDGSTNIYGSTIGADNLNPFTPVKTNSQNQLVSTNLEISDVNNLQSTLNSTVSNPYIGTLTTSNMRSNSFSDTTGVCQINVDATTGVNIVATAGITSSKFVKSGGTNLQYLMADGSVTTSSGSGNSSNIYLYDNNQTTTPIPAIGQIRYNNAAQASATIIYVSHMTRDSVDIDEFLTLISDLSIIYIQDQSTSLNFIKYTVTAAPTLVVNSYISIPVLVSSSAGTGATSFGAGHNIFMSIFSNTTLIDNRITTLELKTQNQGAIASTTSFTGKVVATTKLQANTFIISNPATNSIAITRSEMNSLTGAGNVLIGPDAGLSMTTGGSNTCIGYRSGRAIISTGHNSGFGQDTLQNCISNFNTAVGSSALVSINTAGADYNTAVGWDASQLLLSGVQTTAVGGYALQNNLNSGNSAFGYNAGIVVTNQYTNITALGHSAQPDASNQVILGNILVTEVKSSGVFNGTGFKTPTGTSSDYLMANGSTSVIGSSNSTNRYLYYNEPAGQPPGQFRYNNVVQDNATIVYLTYNTRDSIDIDEFLLLISPLSIIYVQDQGNPSNFIKYTVTSAPTVSLNSFTSVPVIRTSSGGTGSTSFGIGTNIVVNIFANTTLIDTRINTLLTRTFYQSATTGITNFTSEVKTTGVFNGIGFKTPTGLVNELFRANGTVAAITNNKSEFQNMMCYNPSTNDISYKINTDGWRYQSFGFLPQSSAVVAVDTTTTLFTHLGSTLSGLNITFASIKFGKIRAQSNPLINDGAPSGWIGGAALSYIQPKSGFHVKIGFALEATASTATNRTMIGLYQALPAPVLNDATTIASLTTGSIGIVQEKGETVFSFNTRGSSGSTKIATSITCQTPSSNWYILELINEPFSAEITLVLTCLNNTTQAIQRESTTFTCGLANTLPLSIVSYPHAQQNMATTSPAPASGMAALSLGTFQLKMFQ